MGFAFITFLSFPISFPCRLVLYIWYITHVILGSVRSWNPLVQNYLRNFVFALKPILTYRGGGGAINATYPNTPIFALHVFFKLILFKLCETYLVILIVYNICAIFIYLFLSIYLCSLTLYFFLQLGRFFERLQWMNKSDYILLPCPLEYKSI